MPATKTNKPKTEKTGAAGGRTERPADAKVTRTGEVKSDQRAKTRKVVVSYLDRHPKYGKYVRKRTVLHVHDEQNESKVGDIVEVAECRPISKTKFWRLVRIVEKRSEEAAALASAALVR